MACFKDFVRNGTKIIGAAANYRSPKLVNLPKEPIIFLKPISSYIVEGEKMIIPKSFSVSQEVELGVVIGQRCKHLRECDVMGIIAGYCVIQDMTATCKKKEATSRGLPWLLVKAFDTACPVSRFISKEEIPNPDCVEVYCKVNGKPRQCGNTRDLIFSISSLISFISRYVTLEPNDLILTGTYPNNGPVYPCDVVESGISGVVQFCFTVEAE